MNCYFMRLHDFQCVLAFLLFLAAPLLFALDGEQESQTYQTYKTHWQKAQTAFEAGKYKDAISSYQQVLNVIPFEPSAHFHLACCHAKLADANQTFATLNKAIELGWEDAKKMSQAEEFSPWRDHPTFKEIMEAASACQAERFVLYAGNQMDLNKPMPTLILLQGLGCGPRMEIQFWKPIADRMNLLIVAPKAVTEVGTMIYGWHRQGAKDSKALDYYDLSAAEQRIKEAIHFAQKHYPINSSQMWLAGFSQGGGVALRLLGDHPERYQGAVAVCGLVQSPGRAYWQKAARSASRRVAILAGKLDRLHLRSLEVANHLRLAEMPTLFKEWEQIGHEYPPDYKEQLLLAMRFVMTK